MGGWEGDREGFYSIHSVLSPIYLTLTNHVRMYGSFSSAVLKKLTKILSKDKNISIKYSRPFTGVFDRLVESADGEGNCNYKSLQT